MQVISAPLAFPADRPFQIHGPAAEAALVTQVLTRLRRGPASSGPTATHLLVGPDWPRQLAALRAAGVPETQLCVMPIPDGEMWTWWRFARSVADALAIRDGRVDLPADRFLAYVAELGRGQLENGRLVTDPEYYGCTFADLWRANGEAVEQVLRGLADERSRRQYGRILRAPPEEQWEHFIAHVFQRQQYDEHIRIRPGDVILNGGIATGNEVALFLAYLDGVGRIHNIDPLGHRHLSPMVAPVVAHHREQIAVHEVALSDSEQRIRLPVGNAQQAIGKHRGAELAGFQTFEFDACRLDTLVAREQLNRIDLIKLDLEGAEEYVLDGMLDTVRRFRPQIALSIYHRPRHLFELPLRLMKAVANYSFFIEHYSFERWEVVLYAIPDERLNG